MEKTKAEKNVFIINLYAVIFVIVKEIEKKLWNINIKINKPGPGFLTSAYVVVLFTIKPAHAVTCIKRPISCCVVEHFIWIEPLLRGHLSYKATFSLYQRSWPLNTGLTVCWMIWGESWLFVLFLFLFFLEGGLILVELLTITVKTFFY